MINDALTRIQKLQRDHWFRVIGKRMSVTSHQLSPSSFDVNPLRLGFCRQAPRSNTIMTTKFSSTFVGLVKTMTLMRDTTRHRPPPSSLGTLRLDLGTKLMEHVIFAWKDLLAL